MRKLNNEEQQPVFRINIGEYWRVFWRKKYFIIVPLVIAAIVSNIGVRFLMPIYESSTIILIDDTQALENVAQFLQTERRRRSQDAETRARLEANLMSSSFLNELIINLGIDRDPRLIEDAEETRETLYPGISTQELVFRRLRNFLKARIQVDREGPGMFRIVYSDANPEACFAIADAVTNLYIEVQQRQKMRGIRDVSEFSEEQIAVYKERLDRSERNLERFQRDMAQRAMMSNPVNEANKGIAETLNRRIELTIDETEGTLEKIAERLTALFGTIPSDENVYMDPSLKKLEDNLISKRETNLLIELDIRPTAPIPAGAADENDILDSQLRVQRRLTELVRIAYPDMNKDYRPLVAEYYFQRADLESQKQRQRTLQSYIDAFKQNVELAPQWESELARLRADVEADRALYNQFRSSKTSTQISEAVQSTDLGASITVVEKAARPLKPVRPNKMKILALAVLFGLSLGAGGLLFTEFSDSSFRSVEEVEKQLGLKVLGTVPRFESDARWRQETSVKRTVVWATAFVVVVAVSLFAFYFYGKSSKEQMIDVNVTHTMQR